MQKTGFDNWSKKTNDQNNPVNRSINSNNQIQSNFFRKDYSNGNIQKFPSSSYSAYPIKKQTFTYANQPKENIRNFSIQPHPNSNYSHTQEIHYPQKFNQPKPHPKYGNNTNQNNLNPAYENTGKFDKNPTTKENLNNSYSNK